MYPEIPRNYDECEDRGKRAIDRFLHDGKPSCPKTRKDGRLNVLWVIATKGYVDDKTFKRLVRERRTMKQ